MKLDSKHKPAFCKCLACKDTFMMSSFGYFSLLLLVLCTRIKLNGLFIVMVSRTTLAFITVVSGKLCAVSDFTFSIEFQLCLLTEITQGCQGVLCCSRSYNVRLITNLVTFKFYKNMRGF